jgi:hypothetical protein
VGGSSRDGGNGGVVLMGDGGRRMWGSVEGWGRGGEEGWGGAERGVEEQEGMNGGGGGDGV